ncbi:MAG TPA: hypothetical protein VIN59_00215 [Alphaproteobacteria bacterium]
MQYTAQIRISDEELRKCAKGLQKSDRRKRADARLWHLHHAPKPANDTPKERRDFRKAALRHELSLETQAKLIDFARRQVAIRLPLPFRLYGGWWERTDGPRPKLKLPLRLRLFFAQGPVFYKPRVS